MKMLLLLFDENHLALLQADIRFPIQSCQIDQILYLFHLLHLSPVVFVSFLILLFQKYDQVITPSKLFMFKQRIYEHLKAYLLKGRSINLTAFLRNYKRRDDKLGESTCVILSQFDEVYFFSTDHPVKRLCLDFEIGETEW